MAPSRHARTRRSAHRGGRTRTAAPRQPRPGPQASSGLAPGTQPLSTFLAVANVAASLEFLEHALGFSRGVALADADGTLRYAEARHGDSAVILVKRGDQTSPSGGAPAVYAYVPDVDRAVARARDSGAGVGDIEDKPWGDRVAAVTDPDGYRWILATFRKLAPFT